MFNIYYINYEKASEISMLIDNKIIEEIKRMTKTDLNYAGEIDASLGGLSKLPHVGAFLPSAELSGNIANTKARDVEDTIKVVSSKSTILRPVYEKAKIVESFENVEEGSLVRINNVALEIINRDDITATKALLNGFASQIPIEGIGYIDFTTIMEVFLKGSSYILRGGIEEDDSIIFKIPMCTENELECQYSISDLEIGKVSILGIYRGKINEDAVQHKLNQLSEDTGNETATANECHDIEDGSISEENYSATINTSVLYNYIDVIAITQDIIL